MSFFIADNVDDNFKLMTKIPHNSRCTEPIFSHLFNKNLLLVELFFPKGNFFS